MQRLVIVVLVLVALYLGLSWWNSSILWKHQQHQYILNDSLLQKKVIDTRDSSGRQLQVYQLQAITSTQLAQSSAAEAIQLRKDLDKVHGKLSKVTSSVSVGSSTHDSVVIPVYDTIRLADSGSVHLPFAAIPDTFLTLSGSVNLSRIPGALVLDSVQVAYLIHNRLSITHYTQHKFLHKSTINLLVTSDNPHTDIGKVQTYTIVTNKKFFQKWYTHVAIGAVSALVLQHYIK